MQIVSALTFSNFGILFTVKISRKQTNFPPPFEFLYLLNAENWYPSILNWWSGKFESSLVSSTQRTFMGALDNTSLGYKLFFYRIDIDVTY